MRLFINFSIQALHLTNDINCLIRKYNMLHAHSVTPTPMTCMLSGNTSSSLPTHALWKNFTRQIDVELFAIHCPSQGHMGGPCWEFPKQ